jgi:hypothetical protein
MANGVLHRLREIAGSLDLLEHDLLLRRARRDDSFDPLVVPRERTTAQDGYPAGHRRHPDTFDDLAEA